MGGVGQGTPTGAAGSNMSPTGGGDGRSPGRILGGIANMAVADGEVQGLLPRPRRFNYGQPG
jgi:hypothetical protein